MTLYQIPEKYNKATKRLKKWQRKNDFFGPQCSKILNAHILKNNCVRLIDNRLMRSERPNHEQDWTVTFTLYQYRTPETLKFPDPVCHDFDSEYLFTHDIEMHSCCQITAKADYSTCPSELLMPLESDRKWSSRRWSEWQYLWAVTDIIIS